MKEFIAKVEDSIKLFVAKIIDKSSLIIIALLLIIICQNVINTHIELESYVHIINKIENRYRSTLKAVKSYTESNVNVEEFSGEIERDLSADEQIQRKKNHKKYLYHFVKDGF